MATNIHAFKKLILRYESITLEEIERGGCDPHRLTGFRMCSSCTLCTAINRTAGQPCNGCIYYRTVKNPNTCVLPCLSEGNAKSYNGIAYASIPIMLLNAYRRRALRMRNVLSKLNLKQP
jgi:hypothetical protein